MEFDEWLDSGVEFAIRGQGFRVEPPSALTVVRMHRLMLDGGQEWVKNERAEVRRLLGGAWGAMSDAGVAEQEALFAARAVVANYLDSAERALKEWTLDQSEPKPVEPAGPIVVCGITLCAEDGEEPPGTRGEFDPGGGRYDPKLGQREWYFPEKLAPAFQRKDDEKCSWAEILGSWDAIELDFQSMGVDLTPDLLDARPWRWLAVRLAAILGNPNGRARRVIQAKKAGV